jgi:hypothetical protein
MQNPLHTCWKKKIAIDGEIHHLGQFETREEAAFAYDKVARQSKELRALIFTGRDSAEREATEARDALNEPRKTDAGCANARGGDLSAAISGLVSPPRQLTESNIMPRTVPQHQPQTLPQVDLQLDSSFGSNISTT